MIDISKTTESKSEQLDACDLIGGPRTLKITGVKVVGGDQPVLINYEGDDGKPFKPCKTVRRILLAAWGKNGEDFIGRSIVVFTDPLVTWASKEVGGVRVSHLSHIDKPLRLSLTVTRGKKQSVTVQPLQLTAGAKLSKADAKLWKAEIDQGKTMKELSATAAKIKGNNYADSEAKTDVLQHYQSAVTAIRENDAEPVDPKNADFPPEADSEAPEGNSLPGL